MIQIADGALTEVHDMIDRCMELSVQASNGTNSAADRQKLSQVQHVVLKPLPYRSPLLSAENSLKSMLAAALYIVPFLSVYVSNNTVFPSCSFSYLMDGGG